MRTFRARRGVVQRLVEQAHAVRDRARPLVWFHAPSVGEGLQARPVIQAIRAAHPDWQIAYTYFSPSAEKFAASLGADIVDCLPFDHAPDMARVLTALQPNALVFAKLDVWPLLVEQAVAQQVPVALVSGTLASASGRRSGWSRLLLHDAYASLTAVGAIDGDHAQRLIDLGAAKARVTVTGDTRFDQVAERAMRVQRNRAPLSRLAHAGLAPAPLTLVAGSTWPADERVLLAAWSMLVRDLRTTRVSTPEQPFALHSPRLIIAPHEPTPGHCAPISAWAAREGLRLQRWSDVVRSEVDRTHESGAHHTNSMTPDVILVDTVGMLGDLYALADVAYVGGGFHAAGLHSVIEPAAFGVPVLYGPQHDRSREAGLLLEAGGGFVVRSISEMHGQLHRFAFDAKLRHAVGSAARAVIDAELGATARTVRLIEQLVH